MTGNIIIRQALRTDLNALLTFLKDHWRSDHVFVKKPELLIWQHQDPDNEEVITFLLALQQEVGNSPGRIIAVLGYIPFRRFAPRENWTGLSLAIWKVRDDVRVPGLGLRLLKWLDKMLEPEFIFAIGISEEVVPLYELLKYQAGSLHQSALFLSAPTGTHIAANTEEHMFGLAKDVGDISLLKINANNINNHFCSEIDELGKIAYPHKSWDYLSNRFLQHPIYMYFLIGIQFKKQLKGLLILRKHSIEINGNIVSILRAVDYLGSSELLAKCGGSLQRLLTEERCEYIDIMHLGLDEEDLERAGFVSQNKNPSLILPNYFEPFERRNVEIKLAYKSRFDRNIRLMRADSDQDRPNM